MQKVRRDYSAEWLLSGLMLAAIGFASAGLTSVLTDFMWWFVMMGVAVVVLGAAAAVRQVARNRWWSALAAAAASAVVLTVFFAPGSAFLGVIPTPDTLGAFRALDEAGRDSITSQTVPADATTGIVFLLCVGVAVIATVMDIVAQTLRAPAVAGIPLLVLLLAPSFVDPDFTDPVMFTLTAVTYLGMLLVTGKRVGRRTAVSIGATALIGALLLPVLLPRIEPGTAAAGGGSGLSTGINPIITLGNDLRQGTPTLALTYTSTELGGTYLRLTALDDFTGTSWEPTNTALVEGNDVAQIGAAPGLGSQVPVRPTTTEVTVGTILSRWLPAPYAPTSVTGLAGDWSWEPDALAIRTGNSNARGQQYTVQSVTIAPSVDQLVAAGTTVETGFERYLEVPADLPAVVGSTAREVTAAATSNYERAVALQDYFRGGDFTYSEQAPVQNGYDGSGAEVLAAFLEAKAGYCVHFSSAMASMARTLGIPARVAVGFTPGEAVTDPETASIEYRVTTTNLHAWPELYFVGIGWVRFEPTPGRGEVPEFAPLAQDDPSTPDVDESVPPARPTAVPTATPTRAPQLPDEVPQSSAAPDAADRLPSIGWLFGALAVALLLTPWALRVIRRNRRLAAVDSGSALAAWDELRDTAVDLGLRPGESLTPRQLSRDLARSLDEKGAQALLRLRTAIEAESFAGALAEPTVDDVRAVRRSLGRHAGLATRIAAAFVPRSVLGRWLPRPKLP